MITELAALQRLEALKTIDKKKNNIFFKLLKVV